ncbi:MAG: right-handed parallel beta-helix repeat-containing protein [Oscillospiraceae bacterium]
MENVKIVDRSEESKMLYQSKWLIKKTVAFRELVICEHAVVLAPEGKSVTLIVNGIVKDIKPGVYMGKIVLFISDSYITKPAGLMFYNNISCRLSAAVCVEDGKLSENKCVREAVWGGSVTEKKAEGIYIGASAEAFNGILVDNSEYEIENARIDFEGFGGNDFAGVGTGVTALGNSKVTISNSEFNFSGVTRCAIHAGGNSFVTVRNCDIQNISPDTDWLGRFSWQIGLRGSNRLCQLTDNARVVYENCRMKTNGWGISSIDGSDEFVSMTIKNSRLTLTGPRAHGYGAFCIGPNEVIIDNSVVDVYGYPVMLMGMEGKGRASIINGSVIRGRRFGAMVVSDDNSVFTIRDSLFDTERANIVVKGSATIIDIDNCTMKSKDGVLLQLMDTEESGMDIVKYYVPAGVQDTPVEGRELTRVSERDDVILNLSNMGVEGNIFNSTSNIRAYRKSEHGGMGRFHDTVIGPVGFSGPTGDGENPFLRGHDPEELRGPKNLGVNLKNARVTGVISAASQSYRDGVTEITPENWQELSNITQKAAEPVNNGVVVSLDGKSSWVVTGVSYITALSIEEGTRLTAAGGKVLTMTVDGIKTPIAPGKYAGKIVLYPS